MTIVALTAERLAAAFDTAFRTNRKSAVGTLRDGTLAARHPVVAIAGAEFDLAELAFVKLTNCGKLVA